MILASRPVIYIGFGLRDPDFIYVRDLLANTYKGGIRDHYAIVADISEAEVNYWRRNYGVHLIGYETKTQDNGKKDHSALLALLDSFSEPVPSITISTVCDQEKSLTPDIVLSLARHAARNAEHLKARSELPIRVKSGNVTRQSQASYKVDRYNHSLVDKLLDDGPNRIILIGLPGSGKSYALKQATARLAINLNKICLSETFDEAMAIVPIFVDLKLYQGNLKDLINQNLPKSLPIDQLATRFKLKIFIDSFNEMPREYWETGSYETDFISFEKEIKQASLIISSRTSDGLDKLKFSIYHLDSIESNVLNDELKKLGIIIDGRFKSDVKNLLQKPFYFHLVSSGAVSIPKQAHPKDFYESLFDKLEISFKERFGFNFNLKQALSLIAYNAINRGEEAYSIKDAMDVLEIAIKKSKNTHINVSDLINWLVSKTILIPYSGSRIAFVHQSVTEYLAALELSKQYQLTPEILKEKLQLTRWDQALFLTLSLLPQACTDDFFKDIIDTDFILALNAAKYVEYNRDVIISELLQSIPDVILKQQSIKYKIDWIIQSILPTSEVHEPELRSLMKQNSSIGGAAVISLAKIKGQELKDELFELLIKSRHDYNYCCNGVAVALSPFITKSDLPKISSLIDTIDDGIGDNFDENTLSGFIYGTAYILRNIELDDVCNAITPPSIHYEISEIRAQVMCKLLYDTSSEKALSIASELLLRGVDKAATSIYFIASYSKNKNNLHWECFNTNHIIQLIALVENRNKKSWAIRALVCICSARSDLAQVTSDIALTRSGFGKAVLNYCAHPKSIEQLFDAIKKLSGMTHLEHIQQGVHMLDKLDIDWSGNEELLIETLRIGNPQITLSLLERVYLIKDSTVRNINLEDTIWWLEWLSKQTQDKSSESYFLKERAGWFLANITSKSTQESFIKEFNNPNSQHRKLLADFILRQQSEITSDDLSEESIDYLINDLKHKKFNINEHLLSLIATENLISNKILPLTPHSNKIFHSNLLEVISESGTRHGRRYINK